MLTRVLTRVQSKALPLAGVLAHMPRHTRRATRHLSVAFLLGAASAWAGLCLPVSSLGAAPINGFTHVAIDVGHSIKTSGAISARGVAEFEFNRALALAIEAALTQAAAPGQTGVRTTLIAVDGLTTDLASRPRQAKEAGAQLFISVHHDSAKLRYHQRWTHDGRARTFLDERFRGFSLFVSRNNLQWPLALKCASAIGAQLIAAGFKPSRYHADPVLGSGREFADEVNGVHFFDNLAVLRTATMPALLMEAGVIVNRDEEVMLAQPAMQQQMAAAVSAGVAACGG